MAWDTSNNRICTELVSITELEDAMYRKRVRRESGKVNFTAQHCNTGGHSASVPIHHQPEEGGKAGTSRPSRDSPPDDQSGVPESMVISPRSGTRPLVRLLYNPKHLALFGMQAT